MHGTHTALPIGSPLPTFSLRATDGTVYTLQSFEQSRWLVVIFLANHCPYVGAWEDRLVALGNTFGTRDVAFLAISSGNAETFPTDSLEHMDQRARERGYPFPYLHDHDQSVAREFGATRTPEVFVFDAGRLLVYHGAVDSDYEGEPDTERYLEDALNHLLNGQTVQMPETPVVGCVIKYGL
ncbi:MAG: thioredoxin family protein [Chloroflexota bacterium]